MFYSEDRFIADAASPGSRRRFRYKFRYQSQRLFELIYKHKFIRVFDKAMRDNRAQFKIAEIDHHELDVLPYGTSKLDEELAQHYAS